MGAGPQSLAEAEGQSLAEGDSLAEAEEDSPAEGDSLAGAEGDSPAEAEEELVASAGCFWAA